MSGTQLDGEGACWGEGRIGVIQGWQRMRCCEGGLRKGQRGIRTPKKELCQGSKAGEFGGGGQLQRQVRQGLTRFSSNPEVTGDYLRRRSDYKGRWQRWCVWMTLLRNLLVKERREKAAGEVEIKEVSPSLPSFFSR